MKLGLGIRVDNGFGGGGSVEPITYRRPDTTSTFFRPDGTSYFVRP